jgi:hypothetical protein
MMRLYKGQVPLVAEEITRTLTRAGDLEVEVANVAEVEMDIQSVLNEYIRLDRELNSSAREIQSQNGGSFGRIKARLAKKKGVDIQDDPIGYIVNQIIDIFFHSRFVEEVFADDRALRKKLKPILEKYMEVQEQLDSEVRDKIKNLEEGSRDWEVEYEKAMARVKRSKNLE